MHLVQVQLLLFPMVSQALVGVVFACRARSNPRTQWEVALQTKTIITNKIKEQLNTWEKMKEGQRNNAKYGSYILNDRNNILSAAEWFWDVLASCSLDRWIEGNLQTAVLKTENHFVKSLYSIFTSLGRVNLCQNGQELLPAQCSMLMQ